MVSIDLITSDKKWLCCSDNCIQRAEQTLQTHNLRVTSGLVVSLQTCWIYDLPAVGKTELVTQTHLHPV